MSRTGDKWRLVVRSKRRIGDLSVDPRSLAVYFCVKQQNNIFAFKGQSLTFIISFKSYLKRQGKATSKTKRHTCGECDRIATSRAQENPRRKCFGERSVTFRTRSRGEGDDETKDIYSGATKAIIRVFNMGGVVIFVTIESFSSHSQISLSELHTFSNSFLSRCGVKLVSCKAFSHRCIDYIRIFNIHLPHRP